MAEVESKIILSNSTNRMVDFRGQNQIQVNMPGIIRLGITALEDILRFITTPVIKAHSNQLTSSESEEIYRDSPWQVTV